MWIPKEQLFQFVVCVFLGMKTKEEDDIGIATPDLILKDRDQNLLVEGEGFMGQYKPLSRASLEEKLDKEYVQVLQFNCNFRQRANT